MVEFVKEKEIPIIERNFKVTDQTKEICEILKTLDIGEVIRFPVNANQAETLARRDSNRLSKRAQSASRLVGEGRFKVVTRLFDVWIERLD